MASKVTENVYESDFVDGVFKGVAMFGYISVSLITVAGIEKVVPMPKSTGKALLRNIGAVSISQAMGGMTYSIVLTGLRAVRTAVKNRK